MYKILSIAIVSLSLSGCAGLTPELQTKLDIVTSRCPILVKYSPQQLKEAGKELGKLPNKSQLAKMVIDYGKLRDACRVLEKNLKK